MYDLKNIQALAMVIDMQSFDLAAQKLFISQSAVSQRIQSLENRMGLPLLQRTLPYRATQTGELLLKYFQQIRLLQHDLDDHFSQRATPQTVSIAINRDSLDTWFYHTLPDLHLLTDFRLQIITDDQELALDYFKNGLVSACISTHAKALNGCRCDYLGQMEYLLVASPEFHDKNFTRVSGSLARKLLGSPAVIFDKNDFLHKRYLEKHFKIEGEPSYHIAPSVHCFRQFVLCGYGYALIPRIDIRNELRDGQLIEVAPNKTWKMKLYWHYWSVDSKHYQSFNRVIIERAKHYLSCN
ncbi:LysR family transcriptional regulator ArgP [Candidatus Saccharibacteria bacterium]|nr:LysR family transcriptional regulator ArgP [Candidatus Saccharibacteria bacterium]